MSDSKNAESQVSLEKKIIKKYFLDQFLRSLELTLIWSGIHFDEIIDFELEVLSQIPDQTPEFYNIVKNYRKKLST